VTAHRCLVDPNQVSNLNHRRVHYLIFSSSTLGEPPPPPAPKVCFGCDELIGRIVSLAENLTHHSYWCRRDRQDIHRSGRPPSRSHQTTIRCDNRRFIRCDQFTATCSHFLSRLAKVIGVGIENPKDLASPRLSLSTKETYAAVEELGQPNNTCLCTAPRISTIPPGCETLDIPTLPTEPARDALHRIYTRTANGLVLSTTS